MDNQFGKVWGCSDHSPSSYSRSAAMGFTPELQVVTLNPDNSREATSLVTLYKNCFGGSYPHQRVYRQPFWRYTVSGRRSYYHWINLLVYQSEKLVGHVALRRDVRRQTVELFSLALDPECRDNVFAVGRAINQVIEQQAKKQGWQQLYFFCPVSYPAVQCLAVKCLKVEVAAILAGYYPAVEQVEGRLSEPMGRISLLLMHRQLNNADSMVNKIKVPTCYFKLSSEILRPLNLVSYLECQNINGDSKSRDESEGVTVVGQNPVFCYVRKYGVWHGTLSSARPLSEREMVELKKVTLRSSEPCFIKVLQGNCCNQVCQRLEELGLVFSGILTHQGCSLLFSCPMFSQVCRDTIYSKNGQLLKQIVTNSYMQ